MRAYIIKRILWLLPIIFIVAVITFFITNLMPGDPVRIILGNLATKEQVLRLEESLALNQPLLIRFLRWAQNIFQGDFGESFYLQQPVKTAIINRIEPTFLIAFFAQIIAVIFGLSLGILAAVYYKQIFDKLSATVFLLSISIPGFWLAIILILVFGVEFKLLPVSGYQPLSEAGLGTMKYLVLPSITVALMQMGIIARITRSSMLETFSADYLKTAKSKGLKQSKLILKHSLKNAMIPIITVIGHNFAMLLGGTWIIEKIFFIPGTGFLAINSIMRRDIPVIQGCIIFVAIIYIIINFLVDLSYLFFNPKIKYL